MIGSQAYEIRPSDGFARSLLAAIRENYKKNPRGEDEFRALLNAILAALCTGPRTPRSRQEPWPRTGDTAALAGQLDFRKMEFSMPRLQGAAQLGRLMYLVDDAERHITPVAVYTHKQFEGRPSDKSLDELITAVANHRSGNFKAIK